AGYRSILREDGDHTRRSHSSDQSCGTYSGVGIILQSVLKRGCVLSAVDSVLWIKRFQSYIQIILIDLENRRVSRSGKREQIYQRSSEIEAAGFYASTGGIRYS